MQSSSILISTESPGLDGAGSTSIEPSGCTSMAMNTFIGSGIIGSEMPNGSSASRRFARHAR